MSGTRSGGLRTAATNKQKYGNDYYIKVGRMGGSTPKTKPTGFALMTSEQRKEAGRKGGRLSRKPKIEPKVSVLSSFFKGFTRG